MDQKILMENECTIRAKLLKPWDFLRRRRESKIKNKAPFGVLAQSEN